ncbi:HNH endonuclease [Flagellimonas algicola]|uniref:HNH endonuclease n=1 Tax=Flagellimonas algicola TaxID=2583815 RepID=A0ABY2WNJ2_9FLAO|nr:HNH endonuclease [Allomuricauda algicola]TMU56568.1 HNH endonuclease [Allomuricauda algicola]
MARNYSITDIKKLFSLCGNECAAPDCVENMIAEDGDTVLGEICHISAASKQGPRFDPEMTDKQRSSYDNLILLCPNHHKMIDNPSNLGTYTKELLMHWKQNHIQGKRKFPISDGLAENARNKIDISTKVHVENVIHVHNHPEQSKFAGPAGKRFLIKNLEYYKKKRKFDLVMFGSAILVAFVIFIILVATYENKDQLNPYQLLRIVPAIPIKSFYSHLMVAKDRWEMSYMIEQKYRQFISESPQGKLTRDQHSILSEDFDKIKSK